jgi:hypothetical protein
MKTIIKNNSLYFFFIFSQFLVVILGVQDDKIIGQNVNFTNAIIYHFVGLLFFSLGYLPISKRRFINYNTIKKKNIILSKNYFIFSYLFIIIGVITSVATISTIISPIEYLTMLFSGGSQLLDIRLESGAEGLGGIFKMMNYFPVGVFLVSSAFMNFYEIGNKDKKKLNQLIIFAILGCIVKVFFSLDRLTLLAILLVIFYQNFLNKKVKLKYIIYVGAFFILLSFITASRMKDSGVLDFLVTYFKLSIANYELVIERQSEFSYGFNTFLSPFWYIMKFFSFDYKVPEPEFWIWNPAQYFASYLYIDFGIYSLLIFLILGFIVRRIQVKTLMGNLRYTSIYFITLFVLVTFISVPIVRGIEFWLIIILAVFLSTKVKFNVTS